MDAQSKSSRKMHLYLVAVIVVLLIAGAVFISLTNKQTEPSDNQDDIESLIGTITAQGDVINVTGGKMHIVPLTDIMDFIEMDEFAAVDLPEYATPEEAETREGDIQLKPDDKVIGIVANGKARAYPIRIMAWHNIVNDEIGGIPLLVTYDALTDGAIVYDPVVDGREMTFGTSGKIYNSNVVLYDRSTGSYWSQYTGKALVGSMVGKKLAQVQAETTTWDLWKKAHPDTDVLSALFGCSEYNKVCKQPYFFATPYSGYNETDRLLFPVKYEEVALSEKRAITGIEINGKYKAYWNEEVMRSGGFEDIFENVELRIEIDPDTKAVKIYDKNANEQIRSIASYWFAWIAHHPKTELWIGRNIQIEGTPPKA